jgi:hypothetical protein
MQIMLATFYVEVAAVILLQANALRGVKRLMLFGLF